MTVTPLHELSCCKRSAAQGHASDCALRYGTAHAMPVGETVDRLFPCCKRRESEVGRGDVAVSDPEQVTCPGENKPLTEVELDWPMVTDGIGWATLGEDGEHAIMSGHVDPGLLVSALVSEMGYDEFDGGDTRHTYAVFTPHQQDCRVDLEPDAGCACWEYGWFAHVTDDPDTPGALPVTYWRV